MLFRSRMGPHPGRDKVTLFYESTHNMSADIYTKSFKDLPAWSHALKLINIFEPSELSEEALHKWCDLRHELANVPAEVAEERAGWSKKGKRLNRQGKEHVTKGDLNEAKERVAANNEGRASDNAPKPSSSTKRKSKSRSKHCDDPKSVAVPGVGGLLWPDSLFEIGRAHV